MVLELDYTIALLNRKLNSPSLQSMGLLGLDICSFHIMLYILEMEVGSISLVEVLQLILGLE